MNFELSKLAPNQIEILKTIKFDLAGRRRLNAQLYGVINAIFFDQFYQREVNQFTETLKSSKAMPSIRFTKEFIQEYSITDAKALTDERIATIAQDQADATIDLMTREFLRREFPRHLEMAINHHLSHEATTAYLENLLGIKIESKAQCEAVRQFYNSLTQTLDASVGF